jgi:hypothetical protein
MRELRLLKAIDRYRRQSIALRLRIIIIIIIVVVVVVVCIVVDIIAVVVVALLLLRLRRQNTAFVSTNEKQVVSGVTLRAFDAKLHKKSSLLSHV